MEEQVLYYYITFKFPSLRKKLLHFYIPKLALYFLILHVQNEFKKESFEKSYTCLPGYCSSFYGKSIHGSNDSVARACALDPMCKAFRYSTQHGFGFLCNNLIRKNEWELADRQDDWELCGLWSGKL